MRRVFAWSVIALTLTAAPSLAQWQQHFGQRAPMAVPVNGTAGIPASQIASPFGANKSSVFFRSSVPGAVSNTGSFGATNNFVFTTQGNFTLGNRSFAPGASGNAFLTGQGLFVPTKGTFVPTFDGNFVLTVRAALDPKTGNFNPSPTGNFVFSQRGDLVSSSSGNLVPTITTFNPTAAALANLQAARLTNAMTAVAASPVTTSMAMNPYSYAPMTMTNPYTPSSMPYQSMSSASSTPTNSSAASSGAGVSDSEKSSTTTLRIPFEKGHIRWPLALQLMPPDVKANIADPLEADLLALAKQPAGSTGGEGLTTAASRNLARLGAWLTVRQDEMAEATYRDGWAFLRMLDETVSAMR